MCPNTVIPALLIDVHAFEYARRRQKGVEHRLARVDHQDEGERHPVQNAVDNIEDRKSVV